MTFRLEFSDLDISVPLERRAPQSVHMSGREGERVVERERERERRREGRRREWSGMERSGAGWLGLSAARK